MIKNICIIIVFIIAVNIIYYTLKLFIKKLIESDMKKIEKNPKWIMDKVRGKYYGFGDIDIIISSTTKFNSLPRFRLGESNRFELWVSQDVTTQETDEILRLAIMGKIYAKYHLYFDDKPFYWLSMLCYMLDGKDIPADEIKFEIKKKQENS